ncbi:hypothetical protein [Demequina globuliformis]|uniref:hypothetical protein n=1 Tax=Demequina globuliformis TaxID=676202 RepID=UPI000784B0E8|nr:hypothetical protein [Demequina globuliformis]
MLNSLGSALVVLFVLAAIVVIVAGLSEGRLRHVLRVALGIDRRRGVEHVYDEIPREASDWTLLGGINSEPDEVSGSERAKEWARGRYAQAKDLGTHAKDLTVGAVEAGRERLATTSEAHPETGELPTTGELAIGRR